MVIADETDLNLNLNQIEEMLRTTQKSNIFSPLTAETDFIPVLESSRETAC